MGAAHKLILKPDEHIVRVVRRVPFIDLGRYVTAAFFLLLPFFLLYPLLKYKPWGIIAGVILFSIGLFLCVRALFLWYHNVFIVTSDRIIDFDQRGFFEQVASQSSYEKIQDVSFHIHGALGTVFRFGDIHLKTGWGSVDLTVPAVYRPSELQRLILDVQEVYLQRMGSTSSPRKKIYDGEAFE